VLSIEVGPGWFAVRIGAGGTAARSVDTLFPAGGCLPPLCDDDLAFTQDVIEVVPVAWLKTPRPGRFPDRPEHLG